MYAGEPQQGSTGPVEIDELVRIQEPAGMRLYDLCPNLNTQRTLEVGIAYGFSTLSILAAIEKLGSGHDTAIDPF
jgi:predicted O-methyltransferase YrrM